jgi:WD40 repeat protein
MVLVSDASLEKSLEKRRTLRATLPDRLADHDLLRPIAFGSYGEVWLAKNAVTGVFRAIKILWRDFFDNIKPYEREFEAIGRFEPVSRTHPGLVHVLQVGRLTNGFYYIMELADDLRHGTNITVDTYEPATLGAIQEASGSAEKAIQIGIALSSSLGGLHKVGLIHRDVKPSNVIFVAGQPKLADIGLVTIVSEANSLVGTNGFIAPEGPTTPRSDIFSLGKLLYEVATGKDRLEFPVLPEGASEGQALLLELNQVLLKACDPDPQRRHSSVQQLKEELESLEQGRSIRRVRQLEKALRWTRASLLTVILVLATLFSIFFGMQARRAAEAVILERKITTVLAQGNEKVRTGDYLAALGHFVRGARLDKANKDDHEVRLWSTRLFVPEVTDQWKSDSDAGCSSADGRIFASVFGSNVRLFNVQSKEVLREFPGPANILAMDPAACILGIVSTNEIRLVDLLRNEVQTEVFSNRIQQVSIITNGMSAVATQSGEIWLIGNGKRSLASTNSFGGMLSPSGKFLALTKSTGEVIIIDTATGSPHAFVPKHKNVVYSALFTDNEDKLLTTSFDRTAIYWDLVRESPVGSPMEHAGGVLSAAESPDRSLVATACLDGTVKLWRSPNFSPVPENHTLYHQRGVAWVRFRDKNSLLTHTEDGITWLWTIPESVNLRREVPFAIHPPDKTSVQGPGMHVKALTNLVKGRIGKHEISLSFKHPVQTIAVNPQETIIAIGTAEGSRTPHSAVMFNVFGAQVGREMPHQDGFNFMTFSHSGDLIATCSEDFTARVWDTTGKPITPPLEHKNQVAWAAFSPTDQWLATVDYDRMVRVWNSRSGLAITPPLNINNLPQYVTFESENELLVANTFRNYKFTLGRFTGEMSQIGAVPVEYFGYDVQEP